MNKFLEDTNGYKYQPEYWNPKLFAFICSTISMKFERNNYIYITDDKEEFSDLNKACVHQLNLLLKEIE